MDVKHVAKLANLPVTAAEEKIFTTQFDQTLSTIDIINELDTSHTPPTSQVTGLENVSRADVIEADRVLSQSQVTSQSHSSYHGFLVVPAIFNEQ